MMQNDIDVFMAVPSFNEEDIRNKTVVIIDVLRASTTMVTAIENGAKGIIPVENMDAAGRISQSLDSPQYLLCGEKDGKKIEGYHLGNSPLEYTRETVEGKTIILNTTNGTKAVKKAVAADELIIGSFLNLDQVVKKLSSVEQDIALVCAGWRGRLSLEDMLCAGNIVYDLLGGTLPPQAKDVVGITFGLFEKFGDDIEGIIEQSDHARRLREIMDRQDITYSCKMNITDVLPVLNDGMITNSNGKET
ncbi:MAG TPA: 2-phosphosulfolactate phosphatase [Balneolaceae bacterium]|nr:2-phosphosulfolactate phosphatase [Balneolaceae bacterium]